MEVIPFREFSSFNEVVVLDDTPYKMHFHWNNRGEYWSMSIADNDGTVLIDSVKLVNNYELIDRYAGSGLPPGELYVADSGGVVFTIDRYSLSSGELQLVYVPESEV